MFIKVDNREVGVLAQLNELILIPVFKNIKIIKENLPICTTTRDELRQALHDLDAVRNSNYLAKYQTIWEKYHSPSSFRKRVFANLDQSA